VDGRPNRRNKATFSNFSGAMWTVPEFGTDFNTLSLQTAISANQKSEQTLCVCDRRETQELGEVTRAS